LRAVPKWSWWTPDAKCKRVETNVPCLLHIPLVLFEAIREKGGPLMPHEVLTIVLKLVEKSAPDQGQAVAEA